MRIAHFLPYLYVGGMEQMVLSLCRYDAELGLRSVVASPEEGPMAAEIRKRGTPVLTGREALDRAMRAADIVNLHWGFFSAPWYRFVLDRGKACVTTLHCPRPMPRLAAVTICTSERTYRMQPHRKRCVLIPNGVDLTRFRPRARPRRAEIVITRVCRAERCALYFWPAMNEVLRRYPQTRLWIVGNDAPARSSDRVRFFGTRRDVPDILAASDIFVYTPHPNRGTKDLVVMEASAAGVPSVVSDVQAVEGSVFDGENGFRTPYGDVNAVVESVGRLIEDAELRARMSRAAVRIAQERFDMRQVAARYREVYAEVLSAYRWGRLRASGT